MIPRSACASCLEAASLKEATGLVRDLGFFDYRVVYGDGLSGRGWGFGVTGSGTSYLDQKASGLSVNSKYIGFMALRALCFLLPAVGQFASQRRNPQFQASSVWGWDTCPCWNKQGLRADVLKNHVFKKRFVPSRKPTKLRVN